MLTFKKLDVYGQMLLIPLFVVIGIFFQNIFPGYLVVGAWQLISVTLHFLKRDSLMLVQNRIYYNRLLMAVIAAGILSAIFQNIIIFFLYGLLLVSPFMAIWYYYISFKELKNWEAKDLIHLR